MLPVYLSGPYRTDSEAIESGTRCCDVAKIIHKSMICSAARTDFWISNFCRSIERIVRSITHQVSIKDDENAFTQRIKGNWCAKRSALGGLCDRPGSNTCRLAEVRTVKFTASCGMH